MKESFNPNHTPHRMLEIWIGSIICLEAQKTRGRYRRAISWSWGLVSTELCMDVVRAKRRGIWIRLGLRNILQREWNVTGVPTFRVWRSSLVSVCSTSKNYCTKGFFVIKLLYYFIAFEGYILSTFQHLWKKAIII